MGRRAVSGTLEKTEVGKKAVFLDRDGVLNLPIIKNGSPYPPTRLEEFHLYPDALESCVSLKNAGFLLVVATNQPDVGRGTQTQAVVEAMHDLLLRELPVDLVEVCYHGGTNYSQTCTCRKPLPGMLLSAARKHEILLSESWMVGDRWRDVDCGQAAGCKTIFVQRSYAEKLKALPDYEVSSISEAAKLILSAT